MIAWTPAQAFAEIARGDKDAEKFMGSFYCWAHKQDDVFDHDKPVSAEVSVGFDLDIFHHVSFNAFFCKHRDYLFPVLTMGALAWISSEERKHSPDIMERITAQVLKSQYQDIFFAVAFCTGGWNWAVEMNRKYRDYSFDKEGSCPSS